MRTMVTKEERLHRIEAGCEGAVEKIRGIVAHGEIIFSSIQP